MWEPSWFAMKKIWVYKTHDYCKIGIVCCVFTETENKPKVVDNSKFNMFFIILNLEDEQKKFRAMTL